MNKINRPNSRDKIVTTALRLFAQYGYERTSIRMIAKEAVISLGLMYNYFGSKDDLLRAIFINGLKDVEASFTIDSQPLDIETYLRRTFGLLQNNVHFWTLFYSIRSQPAVIQLLRSELLQWRTFFYKNLAQLLANNQLSYSSAEIALLFATIDGICSHYVLNPQDYPLEKVLARLVEQYKGT